MNKCVSNKNLQSQYKLLKHLDNLLKWEKEGFTYPVHVAIHLTNICNNKCPRCTSEKENGTTMGKTVAEDIILQLAEIGVKSTAFGGGGEPSCNPNFANLIRFSKKNNLDVAVHSNGYKLSDEVIEAIAGNCTWARISLDADSPGIYKKTHDMNEQAFNNVISNIRKLVNEKKKRRSDLVIGITYLIGMHTIQGAYNATKLAKNLGVDNIRLRHFFNYKGAGILKEAGDIQQELERCKELEDNSFSVSYPDDRVQSMHDKRKRNYEKCYIHHFNSIITPDAKVYPCCLLAENERFCLGDLTKKTFKDIWQSERRRQAYSGINLDSCPNPCMLEKHNDLLWAIRHNELSGDIKIIELLRAIGKPIPHANFL